MADSTIEWTDKTWNPTTGCTKISPGCKNCYAAVMAKRLQAMGQHNYRNNFEVTLQPQMLNRPLSWKKPQRIFVNSMSDLFHKDIPDAYILKVFEVMNKAYWHDFQILTKRPERVVEMNEILSWAANIWMGTSVENADYIDRIHILSKTDVHIKFLSLEPLLGPLHDMNLDDIDWVIVGGESGPRARPIEEEWVQDILEQCEMNEVPFFFKQWGGKNKKKSGRMLNRRTYDEMPYAYGVNSLLEA